MQVEEILRAIAAKKGIFAVSLLVAFGILLITADVVVLPAFEINKFLDPLRLPLIGVIAILMAAHVVVYTSRPTPMGASCIGGFGLSFFTSACLVCQPIWLIALGFGSATAFLAGIATPLMLTSIGLLSYSLLTFKTTCEVKT